MTLKRVVGWGLVVIAVVGLVAVRAIRVRERAAAPTVTAPTIEVDVAVVRRGPVREIRHLLGEVVASEDVPVSSRLLSEVIRVLVREGDRVHEGQVLLELDRRELDDGVAAATAGVAAAQENVSAVRVALETQEAVTARDEVLVGAGAIAREEWERSQSALAAARARLEAARSQVMVATKGAESAGTRRSYAMIVAPFGGVVAGRYVDPGDIVAPGKPLVLVLRAGPPRVRVKVPSDGFADLRVGLRVVFPDFAPLLEADISRVFPAMDGTHLATFEVDLPVSAPAPPAGTTTGVDLVRAAATGLIVPAGAVLDTSSGSVVFVVDDGRTRLVRVQVGARSAEAVVVEGRISDGDRVVVARPSRLMTLTDGVPVRTAGGSTQ